MNGRSANLCDGQAAQCFCGRFSSGAGSDDDDVCGHNFVGCEVYQRGDKKPIMQKGRVLILGSVFILLILPGLYFRCLSQITLKESSIFITPTRQDEVMRKNLNKKTKFSDIAEEFLLTDPASLITVQTAQDVTIRRRKIFSFLWGESVNPIHVFPNNVITNVPSLIQGESNLIDHTDQLNIKMEHGLESNVFLLFPKNRQSKFVLFHIGHDDGISTTLIAIESFLSRGYLVGVAFMPTTGPNNKPIVWTNDHGSLMMNNHQALSLLDLREGHPIKFFLHPIIVTLNYVEKKYQCELMVMSGLSGGGGPLSSLLPSTLELMRVSLLPAGILFF